MIFVAHEHELGSGKADDGVLGSGAGVITCGNSVDPEAGLKEDSLPLLS